MAQLTTWFLANTTYEGTLVVILAMAGLTIGAMLWWGIKADAEMRRRRFGPSVVRYRQKTLPYAW